MSSTSDRAHGAGDRWRELLITCGGLGLAPVAPGTFGTAGGVGLAIALSHVPGAPPWVWLAGASLLLLLAGWGLGGWAERFYGAKDPGQFVLDEVAGYLVTVAVFDAAHGRALTFAGHVCAFLLFRAVDILKPPPGRTVERLPGGLGVMLDDIVLALYSGAALASLGVTEWL